MAARELDGGRDDGGTGALVLVSAAFFAVVAAASSYLVAPRLSFLRSPRLVVGVAAVIKAAGASVEHPLRVVMIVVGRNALLRRKRATARGRRRKRGCVFFFLLLSCGGERPLLSSLRSADAAAASALGARPMGVLLLGSGGEEAAVGLHDGCGGERGWLRGEKEKTFLLKEKVKKSVRKNTTKKRKESISNAQFISLPSSRSIDSSTMRSTLSHSRASAVRCNGARWKTGKKNGALKLHDGRDRL